MDVAQMLDLSLSQFQLYALVFLLGSFTVASLSDLRRMSAQREFLEIWLLAALAVLCYDIYRIHGGEIWLAPMLKWIMILLLCVASHESTGVIFSLARGDVAAIAAIACILPPLLIIVLFLALKLIDFILRPALRAFGSGGAYPFMPVVLFGTVAMLAMTEWAIPWLSARF